MELENIVICSLEIGMQNRSNTSVHRLMKGLGIESDKKTDLWK